MTSTQHSEASPFFTIVGRLRNRTVSAQLVGGRLTVDAEVWDAASQRSGGFSAFATAQGDDVIQGMLKDPGGAAQLLLESFEQVTHARLGMELHNHTTSGDTQASSNADAIAQSRRCPACGGRDLRCEFHVGRWCPNGFRDNHLHFWCPDCDRQWVPGDALAPVA